MDRATLIAQNKEETPTHMMGDLMPSPIMGVSSLSCVISIVAAT